MFGSAILYTGVVISLAGLVLVIRPIVRFGVRTRARALTVAGLGMAIAVVGVLAPAPDSKASTTVTRLDELAPVWQFQERHTISIAAPPARVYDAIRRVRANEIALSRPSPGSGAAAAAAEKHPECLCLREQPFRPPAICGLLANHLPGQHDHPPDVAARHRAPRDQHESPRQTMKTCRIKRSTTEDIEDTEGKPYSRRVDPSCPPCPTVVASFAGRFRNALYDPGMLVKPEFRALTCAGALLAGTTLLALGQPSKPPAPAREMAVTFDDLPWASVVADNIDRARPMTEALLRVLGRHQVSAIGFVNEIKLERDGVVQPARVALLEAWVAAGLELGNHTYSHIDLHEARVEDVQADVTRGEPQTRKLLAQKSMSLRYFRHPFLHRGRDAETRLLLEEYLQDRGYRVAPVTIDNYDYIFAAAFDRAAANGVNESQQRIVGTYLDYMEKVVAYYEQQSVALFGREIRQVLLLHANALNATTFDNLALMLRARGYRFVSIDRALEDPAYGSPEAYFGPAGITWIHRWALTLGKRDAFFAGEPEVPDWITRASESGR